MNWKNLLESASESANDELRLRNEYLVVENRILRNQIDDPVQLTDSERKELAQIGAKLVKQALAEIATIAQADTIFAWHRKFAGQKVDISKPPKSVGRHLGYTISDQTVGNILKRHGIPPAPERKKKTTWREFIHIHMDVLMAADFFNSEVWGWLRLVMSFIFFFLPLGRAQRRITGAMALFNALMMSVSSRFLPLHIDVGMLWRVSIKENLLVRPIRPRKGVLLYHHSERPLRHQRESLPSGLGKMVLGSPLKDGRIRDGPNQPRPVRKGA